MMKLWNPDLPIWLNIIHLFCRAFQLAVLVFFIYNLFLTVTTEQTLDNPILYFFAFIIPGQVYRRITIRYDLKEHRQALKQHDKLYLYSFLIALGLVALLVIGTVLYAVYGK